MSFYDSSARNRAHHNSRLLAPVEYAITLILPRERPLTELEADKTAALERMRRLDHFTVS